MTDNPSRQRFADLPSRDREAIIEAKRQGTAQVLVGGRWFNCNTREIEPNNVYMATPKEDDK